MKVEQLITMPRFSEDEVKETGEFLTFVSMLTVLLMMVAKLTVAPAGF